MQVLISLFLFLFSAHQAAWAQSAPAPAPAAPRELSREEARERAAREAAVLVEEMKRELRPVPRFRAQLEGINLDDLAERTLLNQRVVVEGSLQHIEHGIELSLSFNGLNGQTYRLALDPKNNDDLTFSLVGPAGFFRPMEVEYDNASLYLKFRRELELGGPGLKLPVEMRVALDFGRSQIRIHTVPLPGRTPAFGALQTGRLEAGN